MRNLFLTSSFLFLLFGGAVSAQTTFGVRAGLNLPKLQITADGSAASYTSDAAANFYLGGYANLPVGGNFAVQPGVTLQRKGGKFKTDGVVEFPGGKGTITFTSIEVPVNLVYTIPVANSGAFLINAGPYVGVNVSAKAKAGNVSEKLELGSNEEQASRLDYGLNFGGGYQLVNGLTINVGYGLGLQNLLNVDAVQMKNRVWSVGLGFSF
ncbi:porin family protein [Sphingobacterium psychroaquaticum]|uniref:Outer membrane protein beta-barrel domain-containing protein n=1 Tax=Sphingobacterium psychroaquaticum TaxID=561061 RepID=A0A1X7L8U1_9SPHI|nr:porin family protein [Sphingobacterium psychroaquaticum]QBQ42422.1 PorT family protein [Sphingobacterium psychroaquaticum]SMG50160.1 Outer membrane protein beta-barrel domain-containing protein [Sphingobacterium psychroaquaticum]